METAPDIDIVYQVVCTLYHNNNTKEKEKANKWLEEFQRSVHAWSISDKLLQQKRDLHSCYFAATTIRLKIQRSFDELPPNAHESLRDSLITHIGQITPETDSTIVTQLSLAVADLVLLMALWQHPINALIDALSSNSNTVWPLLEILQLIPEEIDSRYLHLGANRRDEIHRELNFAAPKVIEFLSLNIQNSFLESRILNATLRCYTSWVSVKVIPLESFFEKPFANQVFQLLSTNNTSRKLHDTCSECLCAILSCIDQLSEYDAIFKLEIFNTICALEPSYHMSVAHEDVEKPLNFCRIFTVLCETYLQDMTSNSEQLHYSMKALDLLLICDGHFDYEMAEVSFRFWHRLSEELFQKNDDNLCSKFKPYIERLLSALYRHTQIDSDHEGLIDEQDNFFDFRQRVADLIGDVAFIIGSSSVFKQMFEMLRSTDTTWECTEAALFMMQNVAKNTMPDECVVIPKVIEAILNLPEQAHIAVRYTSILLIGELHDWIEYNSDSLESILNFLYYALQQSNGLGNAAVIALTSICIACRHKLTCHINGLLQIVRSIDNFKINNDLVIGLLKGISMIISRLPQTHLEHVIREIISFQFQPLAHLVENNLTNHIRKGEPCDPAFWIDRACCIVRYTNPDIGESNLHPTTQILSDSWPLISRVLDKYQTDVHVMERVCRFIRYGLRMVRSQAQHLMEPLIKQIVHLYVVHKHSCFLYLGSVLVDEFAKSENCLNELLEMVRAFIEPTFNMLQAENGLKNNPDTVDDFFRLCSRFLECCPLEFLQSSLVTPIFQCALLACTLDHREANCSVMKFFCNLLKLGRSSNSRLSTCQPLVREIAMNNGVKLVMNLIYASVFCLHTYMLSDVADVLIELKATLAPNEFENIISNAVDVLPKQNNGGFVIASQLQLNEFCSSVLSAEHSTKMTMALKILTRLYR